MFLSILSSILGSGLPGFVMSLITTIIKGREDRKMKEFEIDHIKIENDHELNMLRESAKNQRDLQSIKLEEVSTNLEHAVILAQARVDEALQKNLYLPSKLNNKLNSFISSVRPVLTYGFALVFLSMYILVAVYMMEESTNSIIGLTKFLSTEFAKNMNYLFSSIITFWFGNRMLSKLNTKEDVK